MNVSEPQRSISQDKNAKLFLSISFHVSIKLLSLKVIRNVVVSIHHCTNQSIEFLLVVYFLYPNYKPCNFIASTVT